MNLKRQRLDPHRVMIQCTSLRENLLHVVMQRSSWWLRSKANMALSRNDFAYLLIHYRSDRAIPEEVLSSLLSAFESGCGRARRGRYPCLLLSIILLTVTVRKKLKSTGLVHDFLHILNSPFVLKSEARYSLYVEIPYNGGADSRTKFIMRLLHRSAQEWKPIFLGIKLWRMGCWWRQECTPASVEHRFTVSLYRRCEQEDFSFASTEDPTTPAIYL